MSLSLAQQSIWLDAKLSGSSVYQLGGWARVSAELDENAVRQSISLVMARHDGLRLRVDDELPRQWLDVSVEPPISIVALEDVIDPNQAFHKYTEELFSAPLPLGDSPLFRIELIRAGQNLSYLLWRFHHLIADSTSVSITLAHWFSAYEALTGGTSGELSPPSSYLKTIAADTDYLDSAAYHKDLAYWSNRFEPLHPPLISHMEPKTSPERKVPVVHWTLAGSDFTGFKAAAAAAGTSASRALFALFAVTLARRHDQRDLVTGIALHRRDLSNRYTLGMLAGVIAVRCSFDPNWQLADCVQAFSEQVDRDLRHQRLPVDILSRALGLSGTGRAGLFEAALSYLPAEQAQTGAGLDGLPVTMGVVSTKEASPISLHAAELPAGSGLRISVAVNPDFLDSSEARHLSDSLQSAILLFTQETDTLFSDVSTASSSEKQLVLHEWNRTGASFESGTLDKLFRAQVIRSPQALAIRSQDGKQITYEELDLRSSLFASHLVSIGVQPERVVGVRMQRSAGTIIAILAILKAGGVYLPLDPAYPADRLDYMAKHAGAMLVLDSIPDTSNDFPIHAALPEWPDSNRLAYIIYTSGTTGLPKGVAVPHAAAVNMAFARRACHDPIGEGDRVLAAISVGFDVSIGQLLLPLLSGATVIIAGDLKTMGASEFWALVEREQVTHINSVPSFADSILDAAPAGRQLPLKRLMLGGEALSGALASRIQRVLPTVQVVNMYGPTETCIDATFHIATPSDFRDAVLPIGKPLSNYQAFVLDSSLEPAGIGISGELYVGGSGLARGYVNAPELTCEFFVANPFSATPGARFYRTGDRARWRPDGELEFLGRADQQVKIRGFRVEPGEIAAVLLEHAAISQAVVVPRRETPNAQPRLIAYLVPRAGLSIPGVPALRAHLAERLPEYMVPSSFIGISEMPLNRNGKLDERSLPSPDRSDEEYIAPRTPTEETIAALFADVLGLEHCGATDHFFELGGHSLLATSLVSQLRAVGMEIQLRAIFETPTVEGLARRIDYSLPSLSAGKKIQAKPRPASIPLSLPQERIWFVDRLQHDASYNVPVAFEAQGLLDTMAARRAMEQIAERHEVLRTRIALRDGRPEQHISSHIPLPLSEIDLSHLDDTEREAKLNQQIARFVTHQFDLESDYPFILGLIKLTSERFVLVAIIHHVAFDGWSAGIFLSEFAKFYSASVEHRSTLPVPLSLHYADFALWQREQNWDSDIAYWLDELRDAPARLELPMQEIAGEYSRVAGTLPFVLDSKLHTALMKVARDAGASLFMVLHSAFAALLSRWSGQDDVVIGTVTANRTHAELEPLIGCLVNTLPLRTKLKHDEPFTSLLERVKQSDLAAYAHQDLPFEQLVEALHPERSLHHSPVFQVMLVLQNAPLPAMEVPGLRITPIPVESDTVKFDLTLSLTEQDGRLAGTIEFAANRFERSGIKRLSEHFRRILEEAAEHPQHHYSRFNVLPASEQSQLRNEWNRTDQVFEAGTLDALFRAQVARTPNALAVIDRDGKQLSYFELDTKSSELARYLAGQGVEPERVVGVRMERSAGTIIALLGILKAGGVYLPLDPAYPPDRLQYMAADAGALLRLDSVEGLRGDAALPTWHDTSRLAYIIYTSGTSGMPKGVAMPHSAAVNMAFARRACHDPLGAGDRVLAAISVGFDVSIGQLLLPLLSGAAVVIAGDLKTMSGSEFWSLVKRQQVSHINSVPSFLDSILDAVPADAQLPLKRLMLGGEALSGALLGRIQSALPKVEVVNMYGPTETCIDATYHVAEPADLTAAVLPIGRPLSNYQAYVLDRQMQLSGIGIAGELYLGGAGLARGYVNAPALTAERFVPDVFSGRAGARLYRTGDLARWREDGRLEFLGRADQQVKIRGFRVEPGEIEALLREQPGVREAAVVAQTTPAGPRLVGYYTGVQQEPETLRALLAAKLPEYMVPGALLYLEQLPLSPNGKLDRKALPNPDQNAFMERSFEAPLAGVEESMAALWAELLNLPRVGRHDNFFELGGHSLLAITLMERIRQQGLPGDVRALFTNPTIAGLAAIENAASKQIVAPPNLIPSGCSALTPDMLPLVTLTQAQLNSITATVPGGAANVQDIYPLAPLQEGILFQHLMLAQGDPYLAPFLLGFDTRHRLDQFLTALHHLVDRHDVLRTAMVWKDVNEPLQVVQRHVNIPVEEVSINPASTDAAATLLAQFDPQTYRLDLSQAPLLRVVMTYDSLRRRWLLLMLTHHLILDHTSMSIVVAELQALMADPSRTFPPSPKYRDFIATARAQDRNSQREYFTRLLGDVTEPTAPFGLLDVQADSNLTEEASLMLAPALCRRIREQVRKVGSSPASFFHLAWASVLAKISGKQDVVFGTVLFGRMQSGAVNDRGVGMFINTLPIRVVLDTASVAESLAATHRLLSDLMQHEHASLTLAQRCSAVPAPAPLFSSLFNYRHNRAEANESAWPGVEMLHASERTNYPLAMAVDDFGDHFRCTALGQNTAYPARVCEYLEQAASGLVNLLESAPATSLAMLSVLPLSERSRLTDEWNRTDQVFEAGTLDALFRAQAARTPNALAVIDRDGKQLSYSELDTKSSELARYLAGQGVEPERVVGVRMERSAGTIIALLGILKAGGVYLPLDPAYPPDRLQYMTADAGALLRLDSVEGLRGDAGLPTWHDASRLAYIIYTSGTSGMPKGVAMPHSAAVNMAFARRACHDPLGAGDRVLAAISVGFDVSIGQLLLPLLSGAAVVIAGDLKTMSGSEFWSLVKRQQVSHINSVPSFLDSILDAVPADAQLPLKRLMLGGEALSGALLGRIQSALPKVEVVNMYGPTETCIDATYHVAEPADLTAAVLPIGRPLSNYQAYVLDRQMQLSGIGIAGELYLGGAGLARGYVNAPALTAERFVPDVFSGRAGARLYRTGDLARWREDGRLEFLGRADQQVKIRGFRVEPGEIEALLREQPGVREAAVVAQTTPAGPRLVGYYTGVQQEPETLRVLLAAKLPEYMVPGALLYLEQLPLSPNGKLDRKALPRELSLNRSQPEGSEVMANTVERSLHRIFRQVLGIQHISRGDSFFELGGDSLAAMRLVNAIHQALDLTVPLRALFEFPSIQQLAAALQALPVGQRHSGNVIPLQPAGTKPKLFCVHPAGGHVFCYLPLVKALGPDQPVFGIQALGLEEGDQAQTASTIEELASSYVQAIRSIAPEGPYQLLGMSSGGLIAFEMAQQLKRAGSQVSALTLLDTTVPGSRSETFFSEEVLMRAMAGELGCADLFASSPHCLTLPELVAAGRAAGRLPESFDLSLARRIETVFRNTVNMHFAYSPQAWQGSMLLVRALQRYREDDLMPEWQPYVTGQLNTVDLDCGHSDLVSAAMSPQVSTHLEKYLNQ